MRSHTPAARKGGSTGKKDRVRRRGFSGSAFPRRIAALDSPAKTLLPALLLTDTLNSHTSSNPLLRPVFRVSFPAGEHGDKVIPAMQQHHDQVSEHKRE